MRTVKTFHVECYMECYEKFSGLSVLGTAISSTLFRKRASPPPISFSSSLLNDAPSEKKAKLDMTSVPAPVAERSEPSNFTSPLKFYQDTLEESKDGEKNASGNGVSKEGKEENAAANTEDDDDIPLKKSIASFFTKQPVPQPKSPAPNKRKALRISSDEEGSPSKQSTITSSKRHKVARKPSPSKAKDNQNGTPKTIKIVDFTFLYGGEVTRESNKRIQPINSASKDDSRPTDSPRESTKTSSGRKNDDVEPVRRSSRTPKKSSKLLDVTEKNADKRTPKKLSFDGFDQEPEKPNKRKASDEEESPRKKSTSTSNKKHQGAKKPETGAEDTRESKPAKAAHKDSNDTSSKASTKIPTRGKDENVEPVRCSSRTPKKTQKLLDAPEKAARKKTPTKLSFDELVQEPEKPAKVEKKTPTKKEPTAEVNAIEKRTPQTKKLNTSIKKEKSAKESKQRDLETSILSDEERFERKRMNAVLYQKMKNREAVINAGSKEVPKGKPKCLAGISFLVTGILESIERDEAYSIIKELSGKVTSTVGKRLNYLIVGEEPGPKKLADAALFGIPILSVDGFFNLIREKSNLKVEIEPGEESSKSRIPPKRKSEPDNKEIETTKIIQEKKEDHGEKQIKLEPEKTPIAVEVKREKIITTVDENNLAWVDKYKPTSVKQIIGQQGPASNCTKLINWLTKWHTNQSGSKKLQKPNPWAKNDDGSYFKAALLSGPPGVGKTTTATLVCKELGFDVVEFNASDTRSKRLLKEEVSELLSNKSLYSYFHGDTQVVSKKHVLIMDEVDGMAGNEDRGGIQELIGLIKDAHVPIICMCNDRNHQKMRSLVNYCYDLRFQRPRLEQIKGFVRSICFKEKVQISPEKIDEIIMATNNDVRQSVNHLCLLSAGKDIELKSNGVKTAQKDLKMGPWEVVRKVFSAEDHKTMSLADKADLFFHDYSMAPLFVQQNYLMVSPSGPKSEVLKKVALTADALSLGDLVDRRIRSNSAWTLLPVQAVFSSVLPGEYMEGHFTGQINFPGWLGKYSRTNKRSRLAQEIHDHTRLRTSGSRLSIRMDYAPFLLANIVRPLKENGPEGVEESLKVLQEYRLLREDVDALIELTTWPGKKSQMDAVDGRVKAALTRAYNKEVLPYSYSAVSAVKKKKAEAVDGDDLMAITENEEGGEAVVESEEENYNTLENDNLIKAKKKATPLSSKASTSKVSTGKKASSSGKPKAGTIRKK